MSADSDRDDETVPEYSGPSTELVETKRTSPLRILVRVVLVVGLLAFSGFVLVTTFQDLEWDEVVDALRSLDAPETAAIAALWAAWMITQGWQTASLIDGLSTRRGVVAFLGPASVASLVPGPSDLPVRFRMLRSWDISLEKATLSVAAGGIFSVGIKLVLPVVAAVGLIVTGAPLDGALQTIVRIALIVGVGLVAIAVIFRSERRTAGFARLVDVLFAAGLRLLRRNPADPLEPRLTAARNQAVDVLRDRGGVATAATAATSIAKFGLFLVCLRSTGVPGDAASWFAIFVAFAIVQGLTVVPITAGDAGVSDIAYVSFVTAATGPGFVNQVTAGVLLFRVLTWLLVIPIGLAVLGGWRWQHRASG